MSKQNDDVNNNDSMNNQIPETENIPTTPLDSIKEVNFHPEGLKRQKIAVTYHDDIDENNERVLNSSQHKEHIRKKHKATKKRTAKKVFTVVLSCVAVLVVAGIISYLIMHAVGYRQLFNNTGTGIEITTSNVSTADNGQSIIYNGEKYVFDTDVATMAFIGVDKSTMGNDNDYLGGGGSGQADADYLISVNIKTKEYNVISISRDSMVDVDMFSNNGTFEGTKEMQLCLSYSYGDGKQSSCENVVTSISRLMYNIPIDTYFALDLNGIPTLNDKIGGVTVPEYDSDGKETGKSITLYGEEATKYVRLRDTKVLDSNNTRMKKQKSYMSAFINKLITKSKSDITTPVKLFDAVGKYSVTNITSSKVTYLASEILSTKDDIHVNFLSVKGDVVKGENGFAQFNVDKDALTDMVVDIYYNPAE